MRTALVLLLPAALGGCAVVPPSAWTFDAARPPARAVLPPEQVAPMTQRLAQLQIERNAIRSRIAGELDVRQRLALYEQLHRMGMELSPLERQLATVAAR